MTNRKKPKCEICGERKAIAWINNKNVCPYCWNILKTENKRVENAKQGRWNKNVQK